MITRVKLKNWKSHKETELDLDEGTNVLVGIMGSGKSAVLDAISYGLFGTVPAVKNRTIALDDLIRNRPVKEDSAEVEVQFTTPDGEDYIVSRVLERGKGTTFAELREGDGTLVNKPKSTGVTEDVTSLLQIDYEFFDRMIYAEQNQLDRFLTLSPRKRRKMVDELLKINKFENARKNTTTLINRLENRRENKQKDIEELRSDEDIDQLSSLEKELEKTKSEKKELKKKKKEIEPRLEDNKDKLQEFKKIQEDMEGFSKKIESYNGRLETLNQQIKEAEEKLGEEIDTDLKSLKQRKENFEKDLEETKEKIENLESEVRSYAAKESELETEIKNLKNEIENFEKRIEEKEQKKEKLEKINISKTQEEFENLEKLLKDWENERTRLKAKAENLNESIEELKKAGSKCPVCDRSLSEELKSELIQERNNIFDDVKKEISFSEKKISNLEENISNKEEVIENAKELKSEVKDLPEIKEKLSEKRGVLEDKEEEIEKIRRDEKNVREELEKAKKEAEKIRNDYQEVKNKIEMKKELKNSREQKNETLEDREDLKAQLEEKKSEFDEDKVKKLEEERDNLIKKQEHFKTRLDGINKLIEQKEKMVESVRKKKRTLERYEVKVKILKESINSLQKLKKAFSETQTSLRKQIIEAVNSMMDKIWEEVYPYQDFQKIRLSIEERREISDYELQLMDSSGRWVSVEGITSGGERTCAVLTLRISFAVVLAPGLSWLVLDEPTHNLDSEGIETLAEVLRERIPRIVKQLILITHERDLESAVSGHLYRFSRDKDRDEETQIKRVNEG